MMDESLTGDTSDPAGEGLIRNDGFPGQTEEQKRAMEQFALMVQTPEFQAAMEAMGKSVKAKVSRIYDAVAPILESTRRLATRLAPVFAAFAENIGPILQRSVLPNWRLVELPDPELIRTILEDEGIALAWVPAPAVLKRLIAARGKQARRQVIGSSWKGIVNSCLTELEEIDDNELLAYRNFAQESAGALLGGFPGSSQALRARQ
ncbi:hypothetical protein [Pseudarthrobacter albicanus]|uniref:hypothetical protein n=1 Tax=Pseudarthrobacter albicanus TaxID=2823873 RepID=UPI001BACC9C2|nr:hypothetical protein [Pseudarthrobacter albicanus]